MGQTKSLQKRTPNFECRSWGEHRTYRIKVQLVRKVPIPGNGLLKPVGRGAPSSYVHAAGPLVREPPRGRSKGQRLPY